MKKLLFILLFIPLFSGGEMTAVKINNLKPFIFTHIRVTAAGAVQTSSQVTATVQTTNVITITSSGLNNLLVVHIRTTVAGAVNSVTDNVGNTYVVSAVLANFNSEIYQAYGVQTTSGATSVTVTFSIALSSVCGVDEYSGCAITNATAFDVSSTGTSNSTGAISVTSFSPAASGELIVATIGCNSLRTWTAGTGYTDYNGSGSINMHSGYRLSGTTSETAPFTYVTASSERSEEIATAFKLAAVANTTRFFFKP